MGALAFIDENGVPPRRKATRYNLYHNKKTYPPKYVLSVATKIATGKGLVSSKFSGGSETNDFLIGLGFTLREGEKVLYFSKS